MRFKAWLQDYLKQVAEDRAKLTELVDERIKVYLLLLNHGYPREQALEIMDLYMTEESEENRCEG